MRNDNGIRLAGRRKRIAAAVDQVLPDWLNGKITAEQAMSRLAQEARK